MPDKLYSYPAKFKPGKRHWPDAQITASPQWCAVDLRDGNQALPNPLDPYQKEAYFKLLLEIGFRQIEIGFPAASMDEWTFCRNLIEQNLIPDGVTISVLTQAREHIIRRTMDAILGARHAICHIYIPTSELHAKFVLGENMRQLHDRVMRSVKLVRQLAEERPESRIDLEFSPEEFTDSNLPFINELCDDLVTAWAPRHSEKVIINLPETVERTLPGHYPDMVEAFIANAKLRDKMVISLHAHNDMGGAVASTELALQAGAERVEGTLFGNGERSGNLDLVTLALNLQYLGMDTGLDFSHLPEITRKVTELTGIPVPERQPYAGNLVFTAFSGSHQDAIHKGLEHAKELQNYFHGWKVPYLHIDPQTIGRNFESTIRINSQSGSGGIAHVLAEFYGVQLPKELLQELSWMVKKRSMEAGRELRPDEVWDSLLHEFSRQEKPLHLVNYWPRPDVDDPTKIHSEVHLDMLGRRFVLNGIGDGPISAFANALRQLNIPHFKLLNYEEHSMGSTVNAESITIVLMEDTDNSRKYYGIGFGANIVHGAARAIVSSLNRM